MHTGVAPNSRHRVCDHIFEIAGCLYEKTIIVIVVGVHGVALDKDPLDAIGHVRKTNTNDRKHAARGRMS